MKIKDLKKQYKNYDIIAFGKPLKEKTIPFTFMPRDKSFDDCEVMETKIETKDIKQPVFDLSGKYKRTDCYKGRIYVYVK